METEKKEPLHVYDWLNIPTINKAEQEAKEWLDKYLKPAWTKYEQKINDWLDLYQVTVEWRGSRYICTGASRLGDVWLKTEGSENYYDHRVWIEELSNWNRCYLPK